jgi:hypothetical protein
MRTSKDGPVREACVANHSGQRNFRFVSIFGFSMILMATWETALGQVKRMTYLLWMQK